VTRIVVFRALTALMVLSATASAVPVHLRCEYLANPLGIDRAAPHLSWQSDDSERNWKQAAYDILVASSPDRLLTGNADVWDSGRKDSAESVDIAYAGPDLQSRRRYYWKIRAWDIAGHVSESLESAWWEMGILHPADWTAKWIAWKNPEDQADRKGIRWIWVKGQDALAAVPRRLRHFALISA
jgi:alpha-L-rhamnosidase